MDPHADMYDAKKQRMMDDISAMGFAQVGRPIRIRQNCNSKAASFAVSVVLEFRPCSQLGDGDLRYCLGQQKVRRTAISSQMWMSRIKTRDALLSGRKLGQAPLLETSGCHR